ncbi:hypothetical protein GGI12_004535, partial [Dipsacomyces acuminosporus]
MTNPFVTSCSDPIFANYLELMFQTLVGSVVTETNERNLQYLTYLLLAFLHQYDLYNPGYVYIFIKLYITRLREAGSQKHASVYLYGLTMAGMLPWNNVLSQEQHLEIFPELVDILSTCDKHLERYTHWDPYHQVFIASLRCLTTWISTSVEYLQMMPGWSDTLFKLFYRCKGFLDASNTDKSGSTSAFGARVELTASVDDGKVLFEPDERALIAAHASTGAGPDSQKPAPECITSYTAKIKFAKNKKEQQQQQQPEPTGRQPASV